MPTGSTINRMFLTVALAAGISLVPVSSAHAAATKNYDCSKAGNANKAACKSAAKPVAKAALASKAAPAKPATTSTASKTTTTRNYDCTKSGNANKAQCKGSTKVATSTTTTKAAPAPAAPAKPSMFQRMKNAMTGSSTPAAKPAAAPAAAAARKTASATPASVEDKNPAGAIAQCKDGTYSHAKQRTGACSRHGGVAKWS